MEKDQVKILKGIYYDTSNTAGYSSAEKLYKEAIKQNASITRKEVNEWLKEQIPYTLHKPKRRYFTRNKVIVSKIDELWQADLVDMQKFKSTNKGFGYILTIIDVLSKYAFAIPVKTKHGKEIAEAFTSVFEKRYPSYLQSDQGKEFLNKDVQAVFKQYNVHFYTTKDEDIKCSLVERFNRTLRSKMFKYFTHKGSYIYTDVLDKLVDSYNKSIHSVTRMRPIDAKPGKDGELFERLYGFKNKRQMMLTNRLNKQKILSVGAVVRIKYRAKLMDKGYYPSWTDELFNIKKIIKGPGNRVMYILIDHTGETIDGKFYNEELQEVKDESYRIKVLRKRTRKGVKECLVHWIGFPSSQDTWIKEKDIFKTNG